MKEVNGGLRIHMLGVCYLCALISYSAVTTMMYNLYSQAHLGTLILVNGMLAFLGFGFSNPIVLHILKQYNLKQAIMVSFVGVAVGELVILGTVEITKQHAPVLSNIYVVWAVNMVSSLSTGISNSIMWYTCSHLG